MKGETDGITLGLAERHKDMCMGKHICKKYDFWGGLFQPPHLFKKITFFEL